MRVIIWFHVPFQHHPRVHGIIPEIRQSAGGITVTPTAGSPHSKPPCHGTHGWKSALTRGAKSLLTAPLSRVKVSKLVCPVGRTSSIDGCSGCGATRPTSSSRLTMRRMAMLNSHGHHGHARGHRVTGSPIGNLVGWRGALYGPFPGFSKSLFIDRSDYQEKTGITGDHRDPVDVSGCLWSTRIIQSTRRING